jgi:hypothetical protein
MTKTIIISEGYSKVYIVPGIFILALSIPFFIFKTPVGFVLALIAIILFLFKTGFEINVERKCCRGYKEIFGLRMGTWKNLKPYHFAWLKFTHERDADDLFHEGESGSMFQSVTFDLYVKNDKQQLHLYEFVSYKLFRESLMALVDKLNFEYADDFEESKRRVHERIKKFRS